MMVLSTGRFFDGRWVCGGSWGGYGSLGRVVGFGKVRLGGNGWMVLRIQRAWNP